MVLVKVLKTVTLCTQSVDELYHWTVTLCTQFMKLPFLYGKKKGHSDKLLTMGLQSPLEEITSDLQLKAGNRLSSEFLVYEGKWWNTLRSLYFFQVNSLRPNDAYVSKIAVIGSDNGLSPDRRQPNIWTNAGILLIGPSGTNFREIVIEIHTFSFIWKCRLENNGHFVSVSMCCSGSLLFDGRFVTLERYWTPGLCYFLQCLTIYFSHRATLINMDFSKWSQ